MAPSLIILGSSRLLPGAFPKQDNFVMLNYGKRFSVGHFNGVFLRFFAGFGNIECIGTTIAQATWLCLHGMGGGRVFALVCGMMDMFACECGNTEL